jgi:hypothetical protein
MGSIQLLRATCKRAKKMAGLFPAVIFSFFFCLTANAASDGSVQFHLDLVSAYVSKGMEYGDSPAVQPEVTYTFSGSGIVIGLWSSIALLEHDGERYREIDPYILIPAGNLSIIITDYYLPQLGSFFNYGNDPDAPHTVELSALYTAGKLNVYGAVEIGGYDFDKARYLETRYTIYEKGGYTAKIHVGAGDEMMYAPGKGDDFALVNAGITVSRDHLSVSLAVNPDYDRTYLVVKASF